VESVFQHLSIDHVFFVFFFSSRRRHTRSTRDWSSDVCSSDLIVLARGAEREHDGGEREELGCPCARHQRQDTWQHRAREEEERRSEERRVGKECRWGRWGESGNRKGRRTERERGRSEG